MAAPAPASSSSRRTKDPSQTDAVVGQFKIQMEIGKGSFATVYRAIHSKSRLLVAIKSVHLQKLNKKLKENLYSEIHILKDLHHPHIVALIDCQETSAHIHLVMEFCQLGDLSYFIKKRDRLASHPATADMMRKYPAQAGGGLHEVIVRHFLKQLASALEFLRARNFIHRDIKPQNLLLNPSPRHFAQAQAEIPYAASENSLVPAAGVESLPMLKVADFGFARSLPATSLAETLCGSPLYMAPEILRYEKYDAKVDLWSIGAVVFEMAAGRPPFRASNHVELLRRIERGDDRIGFPEGLLLSEDLKNLIRRLLKRNPVERLAFDDFFDHPVLRDDIPGLVDEDRPKEASSPKPSELPQIRRNSGASLAATPMGERQRSAGGRAPQIQTSEASGRSSAGASKTTSTAQLHPSAGGQSPRLASQQQQQRASDGSGTTLGHRETSHHPLRRPGMVSHVTAPARQELHQGPGRGPVAVAAEMERQISRNSSSPGSSLLVQRQREQEPKSTRADDRSTDAQERAEQEVAFERDYVVVEKRAVEVNAFADELANSPRITGVPAPAPLPTAGHPSGAMTRRATTQGNLPTTHGGQTRAIQVVTRPDHLHQRRSSYERRYGVSPSSATSAISKALNLANHRLSGVGFLPPFFGKTGYSPPQAYAAFPAYPATQGSLVMVGDAPRTGPPSDEDARTVQTIEEAATRSDVVYGFAEVKYKQLIPLAPSTQQGLGLRSAGIAEESVDDHGTAIGGDDGLTLDAILTLSEEALVLYVKALALLAKSMDIAGAWWARKNRSDGVVGSPSSRAADHATPSSITAGNRINNVVQWVRSRFNEVLEKAEFVTLKLLEAQKQLPMSHPSHPSNHPAASASRLGTSADTVVVGSGVTAEKLMYERALEMSRAAAVNELVGEDLAGCEIAYVTAVRMLEAVLETDDEAPTQQGESGSGGGGGGASSGDVNGMQAEDRQVVEKMVESLRGRLAALRKKINLLTKRQTSPTGGGGGGGTVPHAPVKAASTSEVPTIAGTPP
ncbi:MAG: hypothetical protein M1823_003626 [Watsoniomyces obsoletus]|nr:MAG: hypothetical protein M1823_003626 [Watsoniomyces obsoletus]